MNAYLIIKFIHVVSAIVAVGLNCSYPIWFMAARRQHENLLFTLQGIKKMDDWVANPSYLISLATGLLLVYFGNYSFFDNRWILFATILFGMMGLVAFGFYSPLLSSLIKTLKTTGSNNEEYQRLDKKQIRLGALLIIIAMSIVFLMISKPNLKL
ncbi:MAG TPA: DUF2269 family protein [Flavisolibacter sp.]|jgi:uncharacterized membrane protein|nr:DUF2269 family protein [Flavisolibacter sp.]